MNQLDTLNKSFYSRLYSKLQRIFHPLYNKSNKTNIFIQVFLQLIEYYQISILIFFDNINLITPNIQSYLALLFLNYTSKIRAVLLIKGLISHLVLVLLYIIFSSSSYKSNIVYYFFDSHRVVNKILFIPYLSSIFYIIITSFCSTTKECLLRYQIFSYIFLLLLIVNSILYSVMHIPIYTSKSNSFSRYYPIILFLLKIFLVTQLFYQNNSSSIIKLIIQLTFSLILCWLKYINLSYNNKSILIANSVLTGQLLYFSLSAIFNFSFKLAYSPSILILNYFLSLSFGLLFYFICNQRFDKITYKTFNNLTENETLEKINFIFYLIDNFKYHYNTRKSLLIILKEEIIRTCNKETLDKCNCIKFYDYLNQTFLICSATGFLREGASWNDNFFCKFHWFPPGSA